MGIQRGAFENVNLGAAAGGVNATYHERNSINAGLQANASGLRSLAASYEAIGAGLQSISRFCSKVADMTVLSKEKTDKNRGDIVKWKAELDKAVTNGASPESQRLIENEITRAYDRMNYQSYWMFGQDDTNPNYKGKGK